MKGVIRWRWFMYLTVLVVLGAGRYLYNPEWELPKPDRSAPWTIHDAAWHSRNDAINREVASTNGDSWAGTYYVGDGLGSNTSLSLAPGAGFTCVSTHCTGMYGYNHGAVSLAADGSLAFALVRSPAKFGQWLLDAKFFPVRWGERRYLLRIEDMPTFARMFHDPSGPSNDIHGSFFVRVGDQDKPVSGTPDVPASWRCYLAESPIVAEITAVRCGPLSGDSNGPRRRTTELTLDRGASDGLFPEMALQIVGSWYHLLVVRVVSVSPDSASATLEELGYGNDFPAPPAVGMSVATWDAWAEQSESP